MLLMKLTRQRTVVDPNTPPRWIYRWQRTSRRVIKSARRTSIPGKRTPDRMEIAVGGYQSPTGSTTPSSTRHSGTTASSRRAICSPVAVLAITNTNHNRYSQRWEGKNLVTHVTALSWREQPEDGSRGSQPFNGSQI